MTRVNTEQLKHTPWFAKAGAACSIVPIARFVGPNIFALKGGGYGCLFALTGIDEEGLTDLELESRMRSIEGSLRGLPEGSCLYQYTRVMSGFDLPRQAKYANPATEVFASDRLTFLEKTAGFRRIDLHWCLTLEPSKVKAFDRKPQENTVDTSRMLADLEKTATILQSHLGSAIGLRLLSKDETFQFFSYLFNLEEWAERDQLRSDTGVDRQIAKTPVAWHSDYLQVGKRHVTMFSLKTTPEASRPCLFSGLLRLDCDSVLCSTWRVKSTSSARSEIDAQEKFISFFKVGVLTRVMSGSDTASLETGAGAKAANNNVDDLSEVIRSLDKKAQGEYSLRLLLAAGSQEQLRNTVPAVHRIFVDARAQVMEETLGNLSAFYAMFPGNHKFNVFPLWLAEDHHARLSSVFAPNIGHPHSEDLDNEYLNIFETRTRTPFFQDVYVDGVRVMLIIGPTGSGKTTLIMQLLRQIRDRGDVAIVYDPASEFVQRFYDEKRGDIILNPLDARCPFWSPAMEIESNQEATTISESLYQPSGGNSNSSNKEFFYRTPAQIFAHLLREGPTPHTLAEWMADESFLQKKVKGTEMAFYIDRKAGPQAAGVLASLGLVAQSLRLLPRKEETTSIWNATDWAKKREGWIFITSKKSQREVLRPLISLWIDILVMRLMEIPKPGQKQVWFVLDELASLQKLPQLHSAMTESRKSKNPLVVGFQGRAQLEDIYGKIAEVMLSQPATKIFMKTTEGKAAEWISDTLGKVEIERLKETHFDGSRAGKNYTIDRQIEPLVMASEISGLEDRRAYLKLGNRIARFDFDYHGLPTVTDAFIPRENAADKLKFDRRTLEPLTPAASPAPVEPPAKPETPTESKPEANNPQEPKQKGGAQYRRALTLAWDGPEEKANTRTIEQPAAQFTGLAAVAAEFLQELQQFRESLEEQGRDFSEDELKAVKEEWVDIVKRAEEQPEQTTSDPILLTDLDPYLIPLHDPQHHTHVLPPYDDEQFSLSLE